MRRHRQLRGMRGVLLGLFALALLLLVQSSRTNPPACSMTGPREDCGFFGIDQAQCEARGCCWGPTHARVQVAATGSEEGHGQGQAGTQAHGAGWADVPWCFRPNGPVESYLVTAVQATELGYQMTLTPNEGHVGERGADDGERIGQHQDQQHAGKGGDTQTKVGGRASRFSAQARRHGAVFGADFALLQAEVQLQTSQRLLLKIGPPAGANGSSPGAWEVPAALIPRPPPPQHRPDSPALRFVPPALGQPFHFAVERAGAEKGQQSGGGTTPGQPSLLNTAGFSFAFKRQYIELTTAVPPTASLYGLGDTPPSEGLRLVRDGRTLTLWNSDTFAGAPNHNVYSSHPFYLEVREDGSAHGVLLLSSNGMDVVLGAEALTFRVIGGIVELYVFAGPSPEAVLQQYHELIGKPAMPPTWALGFHTCRWGFQDVGALQEVLDGYRAARIPLDVVWTDIDYMDAYRDFTWSPQHFPQDRMRAFVDGLHAAGMRWVPIIDPGIAVAPGTEAYDRGLQEGVFIRDRTGSPLLGEVWPGPTHWPDFLNPAAPPYWQALLTRMWQQVPFDGLWIDMNEASNFCPGDVCTLPPGLAQQLGVGQAKGPGQGTGLAQEQQQQLEVQQDGSGGAEGAGGLAQKAQQAQQRPEVVGDKGRQGQKQPKSREARRVAEEAGRQHTKIRVQWQQAQEQLQQMDESVVGSEAPDQHLDAGAEGHGRAMGHHMVTDGLKPVHERLSIRQGELHHRQAHAPLQTRVVRTHRREEEEEATQQGQLQEGEGQRVGNQTLIGAVSSATANCRIQCQQASPDDPLTHPPYAINNQNNHLPLNFMSLAPTATHWGGLTQYDAHNLYGLSESKVTYQVLEELLGARPFVLSRSTFPSSGRWAARWTGDNAATWENLRWSVPGMLQSGLWGIPLSGADICGFQGATTVELCTRWVSAGAFYPFSRSHNTLKDPPQEPFRWPEVAEAARRALGLRYQLLPHLVTAFYTAHRQGGAVARPLLLEWPQHAVARSGRAADEQWLLGRSVLVAPVLHEGAQAVEDMWVPPGTWVSAWDHAHVLQGPAWVRVAAPLGCVPVFFRAGSVIPMHGVPASAATTAPTSQDTLRTPLTLLAVLGPDASSKGHTGQGQGEGGDQSASKGRQQLERAGALQGQQGHGQVQQQQRWWQRPAGTQGQQKEQGQKEPGQGRSAGLRQGEVEAAQGSLYADDGLTREVGAAGVTIEAGMRVLTGPEAGRRQGRLVYTVLNRQQQAAAQGGSSTAGPAAAAGPGNNGSRQGGAAQLQQDEALKQLCVGRVTVVGVPALGQAAAGEGLAGSVRYAAALRGVQLDESQVAYNATAASLTLDWSAGAQSCAELQRLAAASRGSGRAGCGKAGFVQAGDGTRCNSAVFLSAWEDWEVEWWVEDGAAVAA